MAGSTGHSWGIGSGATPPQLRRFEASLAPLAAALAASGGPFLAGGQLSAADAVLYPFVERFALALSLFHGYDLAAFDGGSVAAWLVRGRGRAPLLGRSVPRAGIQTRRAPALDSSTAYTKVRRRPPVTAAPAAQIAGRGRPPAGRAAVERGGGAARGGLPPPSQPRLV